MLKEEYMNGLKYLIKTRNSIIDKNEATAFIQLFDLPSNGQNDVERKRYKLIRDLYFIAVGFYRVEQSDIFGTEGEMEVEYDAMLKAAEDKYTVPGSLKNGLNEQKLFLNTHVREADTYSKFPKTREAARAVGRSLLGNENETSLLKYKWQDILDIMTRKYKASVATGGGGIIKQRKGLYKIRNKKISKNRKNKGKPSKYTKRFVRK
jgi:hypothetical protein